MRAMQAVLAALFTAASLEAAAIRIRVTGDRVALRSRDNLQSEVLGLAAHGQELRVLEGLEGEWVRVEPPDEISLWIYAELVQDGVVTVDKAKVRGGPGLNYKDVGSLARDARVEARGRLGEWLKIKPPAGTSLWINRQYVEPLEAPAVTAVPVAATPRPEDPVVGQNAAVAAPPEPAAPPALPDPLPEQAVEPVPAPSPRPGALADQPLDPHRPQGVQARYTGELSAVGRLVLRRPGQFRLIQRDAQGRAVTLCYLVGPSEQLASARGATVRVEGPVWWIAGLPYPCVQAQRVVRLEGTQTWSP